MEDSRPVGSAVLSAANIIFFVALLGLLFFIFTLPLFPSGDGGMHLYLSGIAASLLQHQPDYAGVYQIRHLFAPYVIHYWAIIGFKRFLSQDNAEKLFIAIIFLNSAFGFRFLAKRLGRNAAVSSLFMLPLLLNWTLTAGMLNYNFAIGVALWAYGFWLDLPPSGYSSALIGLIAAVVLLVFSHPVPLMILVFFFAADLLLTYLQQRPVRLREHVRAYRFRYAALLLTCMSLLAPALLLDKGAASAVLPDIHPHIELLLKVLNGSYLGAFSAHSLTSYLYTVGLLLIVPGTVVLLAPGAVDRWRTKEFGAAERLLLISLIFLGCTLSFPHTLNGAYYFPHRIWIMMWVFILACSSAASLRPRWLALCAMYGTLLILITGTLAVQELRPIAKMQAALEQANLPMEGKGIYLYDQGVKAPGAFGMNYPVFDWSGARAFSRNHAIMLNNPWIQQSHLPVEERGRAGLLKDNLSLRYTEQPVFLLELLEGSSPERDLVLQRSDFILFSDPDQGVSGLKSGTQEMLHGKEAEWRCSYSDFFALCLHVRN